MKIRIKGTKKKKKTTIRKEQSIYYTRYKYILYVSNLTSEEATVKTFLIALTIQVTYKVIKVNSITKEKSKFKKENLISGTIINGKSISKKK